MTVLGRQAASQTPSASPVSGDIAPFQARLGDLLALVPPAEESEDQPFLFTFADIERQLASLGLPHPTGDTLPDGFLEGIEVLPLVSNAYLSALMPEWWETFGFEPFQVGRALEVGGPPNTITVFAGGLDPERVRSALLKAGYTEVDQETGGSYLTFGDDLDPTTLVGQLGVGAMNQAVLGDDYVIFARQESSIQQVTPVISGNTASMLEEGAWASMLETYAEDTVAMIALRPDALASLGDVSAIEQFTLGVREGADNADLKDTIGSGVGEMGLTSIEDFPPTRARVQVRIRYADEATAAVEVEAIPQRWQQMLSPLTREPLINLMLVEDASVAEEDPTVVAIDLRVKGPSGWWYQMVFQNDLAPFVPNAG
jgi:hypothetical protein